MSLNGGVKLNLESDISRPWSFACGCNFLKIGSNSCGAVCKKRSKEGEQPTMEHGQNGDRRPFKTVIKGPRHAAPLSCSQCDRCTVFHSRTGAKPVVRSRLVFLCALTFLCPSVRNYSPFLSFIGLANENVGTSTPKFWLQLPRIGSQRLVLSHGSRLMT